MRLITPMRNWLAFILLALSSVSAVVSPCAAQDSGEANRKVVNKVIPQYPALARQMKIQGNVRVDVLVEPTGKVRSMEARGGHPVLVQSAEEALRQWKWEPASHESHEIVELRFNPD
jgi:TonB family protein